MVATSGRHGARTRENELLTKSQAQQIADANKALHDLPNQAFCALVQDVAMNMQPDAVTRLSNQLATIAHHKSRGDLDTMLRRAEGQV